MEVIRARNVNDAWDQAKVLLNASHIVRPSRVGEVWEYPVPVTTVYDRPQERILFNEERNVNPYFHFMEGLWMLSGSNEIAWLVQFNKRMVDFSDDGIIQHGAYGHRWRRASTTPPRHSRPRGRPATYRRAGSGRPGSGRSFCASVPSGGPAESGRRKPARGPSARPACRRVKGAPRLPSPSAF